MKFRTFFSFMVVAAALGFSGFCFYSGSTNESRVPASASFNWSSSLDAGYAFQGATISRAF